MPEPRRRPRIAITLGDPRGIGPEVTEKALLDRELLDTANYTVLGPSAALPRRQPQIDYVEIGGWTPGADAATAGRAAGEAIHAAVHLALSGAVDALVTAPIEKNAFRAAGWPYPGHTEMLRDLSGSAAVAMMMVAETTRLGGSLRVVLATTHLPLREVVSSLSPQLLVQQAQLTRDALCRDWGIDEPRLAFCAVNPHASDGGLFGDEESRVFEPAIATLRSAGIAADGPVPADTVFVRALRGEWDAVIAPYHDVGMAAFKTAAFGLGVNLTLGLPFPRTSPDHGTALDIAGRGVADPASMVEAVRLATRLVRRFTEP